MELCHHIMVGLLLKRHAFFLSPPLLLSPPPLTPSSTPPPLFLCLTVCPSVGLPANISLFPSPHLLKAILGVLQPASRLGQRDGEGHAGSPAGESPRNRQGKGQGRARVSRARRAKEFDQLEVIAVLVPYEEERCLVVIGYIWFCFSAGVEKYRRDGRAFGAGRAI